VRAAEAPNWERLHPLSPVVRGGRALVPLLFLLALSEVQRQKGQGGSIVIDVVLVVVLALFGLVQWLVTRWAFDGETLRIETGLIRRDSRQLPVTRIQAVDIIRPFLARTLGVAELRIRLAGSSSGGRLAYLSEQRAATLRAALLAAHHGVEVDRATTAPDVLAVVPTGRLAG
jgi:putative membrane protein